MDAVLTENRSYIIAVVGGSEATLTRCRCPRPPVYDIEDEREDFSVETPRDFRVHARRDGSLLGGSLWSAATSLGPGLRVRHTLRMPSGPNAGCQREYPGGAPRYGQVAIEIKSGRPSHPRPTSRAPERRAQARHRVSP